MLDFNGSLEARMSQLHALIGDAAGWTTLGSSFGGLMAALFACQRPQQVEKLVLRGRRALIPPDFAAVPTGPIDVPTVIYHGSQDPLIPLEAAAQFGIPGIPQSGIPRGRR